MAQSLSNKNRLLEKYVPVVRQDGLNTNKNVNIGINGTTANLWVSGTITTGGTESQGATTITAASANALAVGPNGTTNPTFNVDTSTASAATGLDVIGAAAGAGLALNTLSSQTNESVTLSSKGNGGVFLTQNATQAIQIANTQVFILNGRQLSVNGAILSNTTGGVGYATGSGGAVTQLTSRTTGVSINKPTGQITMFSAAGSATAATFTVTNTQVAATDTIVLSQASGTNLYELFVTAVTGGTFNITFFTTGGTATDAPVINFAVVKGVAS